MANKFKLDKMANAIDKAIRESIVIAGNDAMQHFKKSFVQQGFTDEVLERWKPRRNQWRGMLQATKRTDSTRPTLYKTGALKRSLRFAFSTAYSKRIMSTLPYSAIHNEGLMGKAWGKYPFKMPKRKFMGNSRNLERRTMAKMIAKIETAAKNA